MGFGNSKHYSGRDLLQNFHWEIDVMQNMRRVEEQSQSQEEYWNCLDVLWDIWGEEDIIRDDLRINGIGMESFAISSWAGHPEIRWDWQVEFGGRSDAEMKNHKDSDKYIAMMWKLLGEALTHVGCQVDDLMRLIDARKDEDEKMYARTFSDLLEKVEQFTKMAKDYQEFRKKVGGDVEPSAGTAGPWNDDRIAWNWTIYIGRDDGIFWRKKDENGYIEWGREVDSDESEDEDNDDDDGPEDDKAAK